MSDQFRAIVINKDASGTKASLTTLDDSQLMEGDVTVAVSHSTLNFKDGLAITGSAPIARKLPMVGGIDLAGSVIESSDARYNKGDLVIVNGFGLSETHFGGYAEHARVKADWLVRLPKEFTPAQAMAIGTAGYTAMLSVLALEDAGLKPSGGPVLVTGAAGGVGSVAISLLSTLGYKVIASTGRPQEADYLKQLGASEIIDRAGLSGDAKPLGKERWAGAVDSVGSKTLANVLASTQYGGVVAACGLAQGMDLPSSVAPFILRGVALAGIESVYCPMPRRVRAWEHLAMNLDRDKLERTIVRAKLADVLTLAPQIVKGQVRGRVVVDVSK
ncbi:MAG: acryloyl-CoA reductase [Alphaproteobacteria bacterium]|nr:acryloyl-CoA reductase [Alphaproteobacteria bacterium]